MKRRKSQPVLRRRDCRRRCSGAVHELECELDIQECHLSCSVGLSLHSNQQLKRGFHIIMIGISCCFGSILQAAAIICLTKLFLCLPQRVSTICCWEKFQQKGTIGIESSRFCYSQ
ncbi:uncharacterized protein LOC130987954 isoform X5 [Salvia miltiorrhiza]|uniref:uncharacterized protein LOC130987954 isoform X5 n=1 Tax=Salvia miltiorrhiza TaxID=226208 RepID=UPI0025AD3417|nr:uncharacterized protein LOC130987954 isoform X5 [Salvia miltiorrhiza]